MLSVSCARSVQRLIWSWLTRCDKAVGSVVRHGVRRLNSGRGSVVQGGMSLSDVVC